MLSQLLRPSQAARNAIGDVLTLLGSKWAAQSCPLAHKPWGVALYKRLEKPMEARGTKIIFMPPLRCRMLSRVWRSSAALRPPLASASLKREAITATITATCIMYSSCLRHLQASLHPVLQAEVIISHKLEARGHHCHNHRHLHPMQHLSQMLAQLPCTCPSS